MITRERELSEFIPNWSTKPPQQVAEELASYSLETKRIPDPWNFLIQENGKLITPDGRVVENEIEKDGFPYELEYRGLLSIQDWAGQSSEGFAAWISPPLEGFYPVAKIVISEIIPEDGQKRLFNRAILADISAEDCLYLASRLGLQLDSADGLRETAAILGSDWERLLIILEELTDIDQVRENIRMGKDLEAKEEALRVSRELTQEMGNLYGLLEAAPNDFFGPHAVSCPPSGGSTSAFNAFSENAVNLSEASFDCPVCRGPIPAGRGITTCPHCGAKKGQVGASCD
jgi:hypothetical protein